jgi:hypothetical protein
MTEAGVVWSSIFWSFSGCAIAELLALKHAPDDVLLDQVQAIGERAARHMLFDGAARLQHTDQQTAIDCAALVDRIDALIRPTWRLPAEGQPGSRLEDFGFDNRRRLLSSSRSVLSRSAMTLARSRIISRAADSKRLRRRIIRSSPLDGETWLQPIRSFCMPKRPW